MELPGLEKSKCKALRRIASHTYSSTAEQQRGKDARRWIPPPEGPGGAEMAGRGPRHRRPPQPRSVQSRVMLTEGGRVSLGLIRPKLIVGAIGAFSSPPFELFGVCPDCRNGHAYPKANPSHTSCAINPHHYPIRYRGPVLFDHFADAKNYGHRIHPPRCQTFTHGGDIAYANR